MGYSPPTRLCSSSSASAEEIPPVAGDVEKDRYPAVRFGAGFPDEGDASLEHPAVRRVEVVDAEEGDALPAAELPGDGPQRYARFTEGDDRDPALSRNAGDPDARTP
jgi:hypothetical protein